MARGTGEFHYKKDDQSGSSTTSEHHWRCSLTADHYQGDGTPYDQIPDADWKRFFVSGWFTERPVSPWDTTVYFEEYRASIEPRDGSANDTETRSPEPDPNDSPKNMLFDLSVSFALGPVSLTHSIEESSMTYTDNYQGNLYWQHWEVPSADMPLGANDCHGASVILDTRLPPGEQVKVAGWSSSTYSYTDPSWGGTAFAATDAIGGFCDFDVVNG